MLRFGRQARRALFGSLVLVAGLCIELLVFPWAPSAWCKALTRQWARLCLRASGIRLKVNFVGQASAAQLAGGGRLLVANHCSWLDILAIDAVVPCSFVAKSEIKRWPILGWVVALAGTIFIDRGRRSALRAAGHKIQAALAASGAVALFAEGTTNDMRALLPFHSNLLHVAMDESVSITPVALSYLDVSVPGCHQIASEVTFVGKTSILETIFAVYGAVAIEAHVSILPVIHGHTYASRHALAHSLEAQIAQELGIPVLDSHPGIT
jgi:1-acyl-sn-glycerol-3-phosphate acyltransferase